MSTEIAIFSYTVAKSSLYILAGTFGGFFPFIYDLIQRQKVPANEKIELNKEFYLIKAGLIPLIAFLVVLFAVVFESVNNWLAALYLGASLPILVEKVIGSSNTTVESLAKEQ